MSVSHSPGRERVSVDRRRASRRPCDAPAPIRVAVLDDHASVRAGLEAILGAAPGMVSVGSAHDEAGLYRLLRRTDPSVLVLDVHHPGLHGLALSLRLKRRSARPRIVLHSGQAGESLAVAAAFAGVDAVVAKSDTEDALLRAICAAPGGAPARPTVSLRAQAAAAAELEPVGRAILAMRLAGTSWAEIATALRLPAAAVTDRAAEIVMQLTAVSPPAEPAAAAR
jgi:two-component system NarL family response regulator